MDFEKYVCTGCGLHTMSNFDLANKPHIDCRVGAGNWVPAIRESCAEATHVYYIHFLNYLFCPYCGERLHGDLVRDLVPPARQDPADNKL